MPRSAGVPIEKTQPVLFELSSRSLLAVVVAAVSVWLVVQIWPVFVILVGALILVGTLNPFAVLAGSLADVLPFVGGLLSAVPSALAALALGPRVAVAVLGLILLYQEFESRILVPRIYGPALRLPPAAVVVALLVGGSLLGVVGALLALPVAAALVMLTEELRVVMPGLAVDAALCPRDEQAARVYETRSAGAVPDEAPQIAAAVAREVAVAADVP